MSSSIHPAHPAATPSRYGFVITTMVAATTAALAAAASLALSVPVWAMFVGWIAFFTRGLDTRGALENLACVGFGLTIGLLASLVIPPLAAVAGAGLALPVVVFVVALSVVALRGLPILNNLLGYFLGLVAWFAAHLEPSLESVAHLFGAGAIGSTAGWISHRLPFHLLKRA
ncbi:hypothetical protein J2W22_004443 [Sphingomonas kyeonggiensis]|uniref:DUF1097 domain-containing protein n=1 Tax=Sphingomonas kyeonggiensis TaxID=1268553 RepID=UPI00278B1858|nr:DUF1097 domain-containing protein [Sphingomonas kyeonggiensis]MDQ0252355.1 hypothetical protein [Sphingomonas kyeonggiensis]